MTAIFDAVEQSSAYPELMAHTPSAASKNAANLVSVLFLASFTAVSVALTFFFRGAGAGPFVLVPMLLGLIGAYAFVYSLRRALRSLNAPLQRVIAIVRDKGSEVLRERSHHFLIRERRHRRHHFLVRERSHHFLILELRDGRRVSFDCDDELARAVVEGDAGVAYFRADELLDFKPASLPARH